MELNTLEDLKKYKTIHLIGIGGISMSAIAEELKNWGHHDYVDEWKGKYPTSYKDGIFSYSNHYNANGFLGEFYSDFETEILPLITEEIIEEDHWSESL